MDPKLRGVFVSILTGMTVVIVAILLSFLPILNILVLVFPVPFVIIGVKKDILHALVALAAAIALVSLIFNPVVGVFLLAIALFTIGGIVYALKKKLDFFESSMLSTISVFVSMFLFLQTYSLATGYSFFDTIFLSLRDFIVEGPVDYSGLLNTYHSLGYFQNFTTVRQLAQFLINEMQSLVPYTILMTSLIAGFGLYLISRYILKRMSFKVIDIPPYKLWHLPRGMGIGLLVILLIGLIGQQSSIGIFESVLLTVRLLISFIFSVIGMAVVWFFLDTPRIHVALRWTIAIIVALLLSVSMGLVLLGIIDHIFNLRKIQKNRFTAKE